MAHIVAGFATPYSPQLHVPVASWAGMGETDLRTIRGPDGKDEGAPQASSAVAAALAPAEQAARHTRCQDHIATLAKRLQTTDLDALLVFTEDERIFFENDNGLVAYIYQGATVPYRVRPMPAGAAWAFGEEPLDLPAAPALCASIVSSLAANSSDVADVTTLPEGKGVGNPIGFTNVRLLNGKRVPLVPVLLNPTFPADDLTPGRVYRTGEAIGRAVRAVPGDARVGVAAIGGLTHIAMDEDLDQRVLAACASGDEAAFASLSTGRPPYSNPHNRAWIAAAGALQGLRMQLIEYIPAYRSVAGTGCGMAFAYWE